jgi:hypothetical protein
VLREGYRGGRRWRRRFVVGRVITYVQLLSNLTASLRSIDRGSSPFESNSVSRGYR